MKCLRAQTFKEFEVICVNDGSTDDTLAMLNKYKWGGVKVLSTKNQGVSQARNEGIKLAKGDYLYFFDPDDYIEPETLEIIYSKAVETDSDAVQFNFRLIKIPANIKCEGRNGNKKTGVYENENIIKEYLSRFIGYSASDIQLFGTGDFYAKKEMGTVWRFLFKRSVIINNDILFPADVRLNEDSLFNCRFFCFASRIYYIDNILYTYYSKDNGAMISSLKNFDVLFLNKLAAKNERMVLRNLYLEKWGIDIFPLFAGSLFLSALEIAVKSSYSLSNIKKFLEYVADKDVRNAISIIPFSGNLKIKALLLLFKMRCFIFVYLMIYFMNKIGMKI